MTYLFISPVIIALCTHRRYDFWIVSAGMVRLRVNDTTKISDRSDFDTPWKYNFDIVDKHFTPMSIVDGPYDFTFFIQIDAFEFSKFNKKMMQYCSRKSLMIARKTNTT